MYCLPCTTGFHFECPDIEPVDPDAIDSIGVFLCCCDGNPEVLIGKQIEGPKELKAPEELKDVTSTGRKRAALIKPIEPGDICEWAGLKLAGGGVKPVTGCAGNPATNIHHGPDKSTLNNDPETNLHKICATCVEENMRLLTEDLKWVEAKNLKIGDRLVGFSEKLAHSVTTFEPAVVESIAKVIKRGYKIYMKNGDILTVSEDHQWVGSRPSDGHVKWYSTKQFLRRNNTKLNRHYTLRRLVVPWEEDKSWEAGWLAGFLDGEGSLSGYNLAVSQTEKTYNTIALEDMYDAMYSRAKGHLNEVHRPANGNNSEAWIIRMTRMSDILSLVGSVRPARLLAMIPDFLYGTGNGRTRPKSPLPVSKRAEIDRLEYIGEQEFYSIQTSSSTYIVEGYLSHNCHNRWHTLNDRFYGERPEHGEPFLPIDHECLPHDSETKATDLEIQMNDFMWLAGKVDGQYEPEDA